MNLLTHYDLDGASCAILLKSFIPNLQVVATGYDNLANKLINFSKYPRAIITDIGLTEENIKYLIRTKNKILWIDHHQTSLPFKDLQDDNLTVYVNDKFCGATNVLKFFHGKQSFSDQLRYLAYLTNDYDLWKLDEKDSKVLNFIFWNRKFNAFVSLFEKGYDEKILDSFRPAYERYEKEMFDYMMACEKYEFNEGGLGCIVLFADKFLSDVTITFPGFHFYFIISNIYKMSVRCSDDFDLAESFQKIRNLPSIENCGCHKNAGGISLVKESFNGDTIKVTKCFEDIIEIIIEGNKKNDG